MADPRTNEQNNHDNSTDSQQFNQDNPYHLQSSDSPGMKLPALLPLLSLGQGAMIWLFLGALSKAIGRSVIYSNSAHEMWNELEERYGTSNGAQFFGLYKELTEISQGNCNVVDYFTKLKMLWDDIDALCLIPVCSCGCTCGASQKLSKFQQDQRMIQFLMGLNDSFTAIRGYILMRSPLPSIGRAYSFFLQEETQREIHSNSQFLADSASLAVNSNRFNYNTNYGNYPAGKRGTDAKKIHCNYCKKPGHVIDKCFKLHGLPPDFKFNKQFNNGKRMAAQVEVSETLSHPPVLLLPILSVLDLLAHLQ
ncbi:uncharacterized protein LOC141673489 [Apium graveolens]|uniref:uncharacterized protein LOC141673489 n=1 Tax=Apium graveolens TaxID=4045 RepID=UPI003D7B21FC